MRILTRYILKEVLSHSLIGLLVFTFVIYVRPLSHGLELVARHNLSPLAALTVFLLPLPAILVLTVPMAVLVGTLIGLNRMAADGEAIAIRAAGIGRGQFVRPVLFFAFLGWILTSLMSLYLAPLAGRKLSQMEARLGASQAAYEIRPRVFIERFPNLLLYVEDIVGSHADWRGVFIADTSRPNAMRVTLAERGRLVNEASSDSLTLHLTHGTTHEFDPTYPGQYSVISFGETDIPIERRGVATPRESPLTLSTPKLWARIHKSEDRQLAMVELNYRLALPIASLVLALVGIPIGLITRKGGKSFGLMLAILLVFVYYILMAAGLSFSKQGRLDPRIGLWVANLVFAVAGALMFSHIRPVRRWFESLQERLEQLAAWVKNLRKRHATSEGAGEQTQSRRQGGRLLQILDLYVIRGWLTYLAILLVAFTGIYMIFDFFQILGDIVRNNIGPFVVFDYYRFLAPQVIYLMFPLSILVATLVTFGLLTKWNEVTAMKSAGISLYRISAPVMIAAGLLSVGMFLLGNDYLPETNQRQDALRNQLKGKPPQTTYRPDRQWIFGESNRIYYYRFFDPDQDVFANLSVFEIDPSGFQLKRRIYAARAFWEPHIHGWVLENGWVRDLAGDRVASYMPFSVATFNELTEKPDYFKKEVKPSEQMSAFELGQYIHELKQSGFDVVRLSVAFYRKFSYPVIAFVVTLIAIPFAFSTGRGGALSGVALSIGIAIVYWSISSLFEAMGNLSQIPPAMAAWTPDVLFGLGGIYLLLRIRT